MRSIEDTDDESHRYEEARSLALVVPVLFVIGDRERLPVFSPSPASLLLSLSPAVRSDSFFSLFLLFFCFEFSFLLPLNISSFLSFLSVSPPHESEALPLSPAPIGRFSDECQQIKCKHTETKQPGAGFLSDLSRSKSKHLEAIVLMHDGNSFKKPHEGERCGARRDKPDEGLRVTERSV